MMTLCSTACGHQMPLLGVCLTECQPDPKAHQMSSWPDVVLLLATRCLYWGVALKPSKWNGTYAAVPCIPFYPYTCFRTLCPKPSCQKSRKAIVTQKVLVTQSSNIVHCNWHTQKPICTNFQAFQTLFPCSNWCFFFHFLSGEVKQRAKNFTFCWFWLGKKHQNGLSGTYGIGFEVCQIQWHFISSPNPIYNKWFMKNHNFRQKFHILLILTGKNASKWLEWHIFRVWGMLNPMALVLSLYDKQWSWKIKILGDK